MTSRGLLAVAATGRVTSAGSWGGHAPPSDVVRLAQHDALHGTVSTALLSQPGAWTPGMGCGCYGVWTQTWAQDKGNVPEDLVQLLNATSPALWKRVKSGLCPYGRELPGSVTWPDVPEELRQYVPSLDWLTFTAVVYAFLPYIVGLFVLIDFFVKRGTRQLWKTLWLVSLVFANEVVVKNLHPQPRPGTMLQVRDTSGKFVGSCSQSCGFPSSHAAIAMGWLMLVFLDASFRVHPEPHTLLPPVMDRPVLTEGRQCPPHSAPVYEERIRRIRSLRTWVRSGYMTHREFVAHVLFWVAVMGPVPAMRVALNDHSIDQAVAGSILGVLMAILWWTLVRQCQWRFEHLQGQRVFFGLILHDLGLPAFQLTPSFSLTGVDLTTSVDAMATRAPQASERVEPPTSPTSDPANG